MDSGLIVLLIAIYPFIGGIVGACMLNDGYDDGWEYEGPGPWSGVHKGLTGDNLSLYTARWTVIFALFGYITAALAILWYIWQGLKWLYELFFVKHYK